MAAGRAATPVANRYLRNVECLKLSFFLCPLLTTGAIEAIEAHANETLKSQYLPKLISGEWAATMNLTEPQAGTDLAAVRSKAVPNGDHYLVSGQKYLLPGAIMS